MSESETTTVVTGPEQEAQVQMVHKQGYPVTVTLRAMAARDLLDRVGIVADWATKNGYLPPSTPDTAPVVNVTVPASTASAAGSSATESEEEQICEYHHLPMSKHEKDGQVWYSHKLPNGKYCKGKPPYGG